MAKLRQVSGDELIAALERLGFTQVRQRGSHVVMKKVTASGATGCTVPRHRRLAPGTLRGILRQAGVTPEDVLNLL